MVVLVLVAPGGLLLGASATPTVGTVAFSAPLAGTSWTSWGVSTPTGCSSNFTLLQSPFWNLTDGRLGAGFTIGARGVECDVGIQLSYQTATFNATSSGKDVLIADWALDWAENGSVRSHTNGIAGYSSSAEFDLTIMPNLIDRDTGRIQQFYDEYAVTNGASDNGSFGSSFAGATSMHHGAVIQAGHTYYLLLQINLDVIADASGFGTNFAFVHASLGLAGHAAVLRDVRIT